VGAVEPEAAVRRLVRREGETLIVDDVQYDLAAYRRLLLVGAGKAAAPMAYALEDMLGDRIDEGLVIVKYDHGLPPGQSLKKARLAEAAHPVPDQSGYTATMELYELLRAAGKDDLLLCCITGGASALLPAPLPPLTLQDEQESTEVLLAGGVDIAGVNAVRKHLSLVKGGRLAAAAHPARCIVLIISDVPGDELGTIASGPFSPDPTTFKHCLGIIAEHKLAEKMPPVAMEHLRKGADGEIPETPKAGDAIFAKVHHVMAATNQDAVAAAAQKAEALGLHTEILPFSLSGEARDMGVQIIEAAKARRKSGKPLPACLLIGGETTVTIRGTGKGGRSQELALAAAITLDGSEGISLLAGGTDGGDGPTDAAGAFAFGKSCRRAEALGVSPREHLENNDAYPFFQALDDLLITGPTRTNVMDIACLIIEK
jgi:hydroxypyruvate reductase